MDGQGDPRRLQSVFAARVVFGHIVQVRTVDQLADHAQEILDRFDEISRVLKRPSAGLYGVGSIEIKRLKPLLLQTPLEAPVLGVELQDAVASDDPHPLVDQRLEIVREDPGDIYREHGAALEFELGMDRIVGGNAEGIEFPPEAAGRGFDDFGLQAPAEQVDLVDPDKPERSAPFGPLRKPVARHDDLVFHIGVSVLDPAELALEDELARFLMDGVVTFVEVDKEQNAVLAGGSNHLLAALDGQVHRLFDDDVLSGVHRGDGHLAVEVVGSDDANSVDILPANQFPVVGGAEDLILRSDPVAGLPCFRGHSDEPGSAVMLEVAGGVHVVLGPDAPADDTQPRRFVHGCLHPLT